MRKGGVRVIRVFLLDDHEVVRSGLEHLLTSSGDIEVVGSVGTAAAAIARIPALKPDVAVLDARLPDGSGIDVCREIRSSRPETRVIILTSFDDDEALFAAIMTMAVPVSWHIGRTPPAEMLTFLSRSRATNRSLPDDSGSSMILRSCVRCAGRR